MDRFVSLWSRWMVVGLVVFAAWGCIDQPGPGGPPTPAPGQPQEPSDEGPPGVVRRLQVSSFSGTEACDDLEQYLQDSAVTEMRARLDAQRLRGDHWMAVDAGTSGPPSGPSAYTTTNVQTEGVDEADLVKNDGERIFALAGGTLFASQSWPASELALRGRLALDGTPLEMLLDEKDRLAVLSSVALPPPVSDVGGGNAYGWGRVVRLSVVDVRDVSQPSVTRELYFPGSYVSARRIGSSVRVVLRDSLRYPADIQWYPDLTGIDSRDAERVRERYEAMKVANEARIRAHPLEGWLPSARVRTSQGKVVRVAYDCADFIRSSAVTQGGLLSVLTYNLDEPDRVSRTALLGWVGEVYASHESLYVASPHWWWYPRAGQGTATYLYKFDIRQPDRAPLVATGVVDGTLVDSFSLDEHEGFLRVASTETHYEQTQSTLFIRTTNRVHVLAENAGVLTEVGTSPELAPGERITSARFLGDRAFVVTFRTIDPLFTVDLADPTRPRVLGELKIPGFSTYLHPIDENHLVGVGQFIPENGDWTGRKLQLSLFDVSDLAHPKQKSVLYLGDFNTSSAALGDHRAFTWLPEKKLLAIPLMDWDSGCTSDVVCWSTFTSELRVFSLDTATGFTERGAISIADMVQEVEPQWGWYGSWSPIVSRSVIADDYVYALSASGIRAAHVSDLAHPVGTVLFKKTP